MLLKQECNDFIAMFKSNNKRVILYSVSLTVSVIYFKVKQCNISVLLFCRVDFNVPLKGKEITSNQRYVFDTFLIEKILQS